LATDNGWQKVRSPRIPAGLEEVPQGSSGFRAEAALGSKKRREEGPRWNFEGQKAQVVWMRKKKKQKKYKRRNNCKET
jgi:hypothetical protein